MNYSTLKEAYSIDSFEKDKKKSKKSKAIRIEEFEDDASDISQSQSQSQRERGEREHKNNERIKKNIETNRQNTMKGVQPHYDEELEKYLNVNDFQNTNLNYYPEDYSKSYQTTNYSEPEQNDEYIGYKNGGRYLPKQPHYRQVSHTYENEDNRYHNNRIQHFDETNSSQYIPIQKRKPIMDQTIPQQPEQITKTISPNNKVVVDQKDTFYKNLVNIGLFIFIGVLIIFLCEQISEIAINIGMKRTIMILEPYMRKTTYKSE